MIKPDPDTAQVPVLPGRGSLFCYNTSQVLGINSDSNVMIAYLSDMEEMWSQTAL